MDPNRHHEYQTHHQQAVRQSMPLHHQTHPHPPHHQQQQQLHHPPPPPQQQQPQHHLQQQHHPHPHPRASTTSYGAHPPHHGGEEQRSRTALYMMNSSGNRGTLAGAPSQPMPPAGAAAATATSSSDPHLQYYTSNRDLTAAKKLPQQLEPLEPPHPIWPYMTGQSVPSPAPPAASGLRHHHGNPAMYSTSTQQQATQAHSTAYWPPPDEQMHHQLPQQLQQQQKHQRYSSYGQKPQPGGGTASGYGVEFGPGQQPGAQQISGRPHPGYAPQPGYGTQPGYVPQPGVGGQPDSRFGTHTETGGYGTQPGVGGKAGGYGGASTSSPHPSTPTPPTATSTPQSHHQSLYMPMPQFSTEKFQTTVHNAIERYVRETPAPSLDYPASRGIAAAGLGAGGGGAGLGGGGTVSAYGRTTGYGYAKVSSSKVPSATSSTSYVKLEPENALAGTLPQPKRSSLYHNPYNTAPQPPPLLPPPPLSEAPQRQRDSSPAMAAVATPPHGYPTKYGKLLQQHGTGAVPGTGSGTGTGTGATPYSTYYHHGTPSPAAGAVASPTPPAPPPPLASQLSSASASSSSSSTTLQVYPHGPDICYQPVPVAAAQTQSQGQGQGNPTTAAKKSPAVSKPNYRALINDMLKRNTASEQELNLQIIKKTLNMEPPPRNHVHVLPAATRVIQQVAPPAPVPAAAPAPALYSPLDLSMRTVKQTADSTEYKYQRPQHQTPTTTTTEYKAVQQPHLVVGGGGLGLPRFDITASFSAAASRGTGTRASPAPTAVIRQAPATTVSHLPPVAAPLAAAAPAPALVIKSLQQMRPSVLETNPYAKRHKQPHQKLPPETSIVQVLPKSLPQLIELTPAPSPSPSQSPSPSPQHQHNSSNPNYLGRKRHLQEYNQAAAKQARLDAAMEAAVSAPVPVIAVNEQALAAKRERERERERELQPEPSTTSAPTTSMSLSMAVPKAEPRIRTKAELKGFTFTPPVLVTSTTSATNSVSVAPPAAILPPPPAVTVTRPPPSHQVTNHIQIKLEPAPPQATNHPGAGGGVTGADLGLLEEDLGFKGSLLDCWGSTCNNLVEQLLNKAQPTVMPACSSSSIKLELSEDDLPVARILKRQPPAAADGESAATTTTQVTTTTNGICSSLGNGGAAQKKLSKVEREKKRLQQEQRIAARLAPKAGQSSSSESDTTELHRRTTERQKKPLLMRKGRARQRSLGGQTGKSSQQTGQSTAEEAAAVAAAAEKGGSQPSTSEERASKKESVKRESVPPPPSASNKVQHEGTAKAKGKAKQQQSLENTSASDDGEEEQEEDEEEDEEEEEEAKKEKSGKTLHHRKQQQQSNPPLKNRILNTMTRSKHRKELELQLANSKVLRNDKIIRNSTTKIKRKYVRKVVDSKKEMMVTRLRNKRGLDAMDSNSSQQNGRTKLKGKQLQSTGGPTKSKTSPQQQLYLEEYRYKVALKIPHRLISINKLNKVAASLPDLERRDIGQELACFKSRAGGGRPRTKAASKQHQENPPKSIIDVLHLRVTNGTSGSSSGRKTMVSVSAPASTNLHLHSETSQTSASNSLYEQPQQQEPPPPPPANAETTSSCLDDPSRRHFSIFDTKVLQSKTRTESKLQQRREIIREIFVGPERPASAPPECVQEAGGGADNEEEAAISYQKYEEFLDQMNSIVSANDNKLLARRTLVEDKQPSATQCTHKRKYLRRKGSSGFDYIRKKKRPTPATSHQNQQSHNQSAGHAHVTYNQHVLSEQNQSAADERLDDTDSTIAGSSHLPAKIKTEMDVLREIQKWVLNKGVGQSTMHKAARQGLIDVVVYCLDRMHMNPDQKDNAGYTPLHEACTQGWLEIARILLQFGANHSEAAQSGIRPLHGAIENDHEEVVRLLLSYGADPLLATYSGQTPLALASSKLMSGILSEHLSDAQSAAADIHPIRFQGPWDIFDAKEYGYDIFDNVPNTACDKSRARRRERKEVNQKQMQQQKQQQQQQQRQQQNLFSNVNGNVLLAAKKEAQQEEPEKKVETKIRQNGETSATKTGIHVSAAATTKTMMVKVEPGTEEEEHHQQQEEDSNNNKNNNEEELNVNVENNLVTSVVTVKNEVKKELGVDMDVDINMDRERERERERNRLDDEDLADSETTDVDELNGDIFEFEEADVPLPPLYLLKDEGSDKWVLLNDLCNLLKVKSKDTLLNKLCPSNNNNNNNNIALPNTQKQLLREFKIDDFLEKATCLQLLCAGEKLNMFSSSKVVLIKYNDSVKNLLGVKTILMQF
ncbi:nascent polypeptide-associated complex subunit alpha muscle-specific form [Drosophila madeirensis]|uniref:Nascent polypeptide-associated complex subunit alpha muscle-specific form n=1 Tax=Drosophila madeirensis TaxID=30013 RepID=A0AAU9FLX5_DROMD